ncbi:MAG: hypothetical protein JXX14_11050, partial [Deltaproteobacteria bacterium]|nr:hypothetical protein [Deltaproteobacteria bacterium]
MPIFSPLISESVSGGGGKRLSWFAFKQSRIEDAPIRSTIKSQDNVITAKEGVAKSCFRNMKSKIRRPRGGGDPVNAQSG